MRKYLSYTLFFAGSVLIASCSQEKKSPPPATTVKAPVVMAPFRFHKRVEVSPGEDFDVLSWGRGSSNVGSFLVLHSDSSGKKYTTTTGDLDGAIVDVYNSDMDLDGNPELLIQTKAKDTATYASVYAFEFNNSNARKLDFPRLTSSQRKGYRGSDNFYIKEGKLMREFPIYDGNSADAKLTGQKRLLEYAMRDNSLSAKQVSTDSTTVAKAKPVKVIPVNNTPDKPKTTTTSKKKKKTQVTEKKKKKRRRRSE